MKYDTRYNFNGEGVSKVTKIKFTKKQQEEMELINQGKTVLSVKTRIDNKTGVKRDITFNKRFTFESGIKRLKELYGGYCIGCGKWPDLVVSHNKGNEVQPATLLQRYCQSCYDAMENKVSVS